MYRYAPKSLERFTWILKDLRCPQVYYDRINQWLGVDDQNSILTTITDKQVDQIDCFIRLYDSMCYSMDARALSTYFHRKHEVFKNRDLWWILLWNPGNLKFRTNLVSRYFTQTFGNTSLQKKES